MIGISLLALASSVTSLCTASTFGPSGDQFVIEIARNDEGPQVAVYPNERTSWLAGRIESQRSVIRVFNRDDGSKILMGDARGVAGNKYYSIQLSGDVYANKTDNLAVDIVSFTDASYRNGYKRIISADCKNVSGELNVEGL
jgi:hypothetical protein